ncbi:hypothetical protein VE03_05505 [Pseudogymnoascus sp. 23342-1-I1]|nr:hypothetical protein VE03_05505 [Pseudogymnoascus sp. 23342-1-I1]
MHSKIVAAVLMAPALIGARPVSAPDTKMVLNPDTYSPPDLSGGRMPAEHTSLHHFADGVTEEGLKRMMEGRDKTLATPKEDIIVHPYRPFADPTKDKDREHFELFEKAHPKGFRRNTRNTDNTERPQPGDHHLATKIGTPKNARATDDDDDTKVLPRPKGRGRLIPPMIGTPINVRAIDNTERLHPDDHYLGPKIGTPKNARAADNTEGFPTPNGHLPPPKIGTPIDARDTHDSHRITRPDGVLLHPIGGYSTPIDEESTDNEETPHPDDHRLGPMIGSTIRARSIDNADRPPHPNDRHLAPKIGTPINARAIHGTEGITRPGGVISYPIEGLGTPINEESIDDVNAKLEESGMSKEFGDLVEIPVDLPIPSDSYTGEFDDLKEIPVDLPISSDYYPDYYPEEFDDLEEVPVDFPTPSDYYPEEFDDLEEIPADLPILSDNYPDSSDFEDSRYIPAAPGDRNSHRRSRLAGPPYPCAGPQHFNGTGFNNTINGTAFNNTINGTTFNNTINGTAFNNATNITTEAISCLEGGASDSKEPAGPTLQRRDQAHTGPLPEVIQSFKNQRQQEAKKAAENQAAKDKAAKDKADKEKANAERKAREKETKEKNRDPKAKSNSPNIADHAPELFDYLRDPLHKPTPFKEDKKYTEDVFKNLDKLRHPVYWKPGAGNTEPHKEEPGHEWPEAPHPIQTIPPGTPGAGFDQGDGWKTDYWQNGIWGQQPRVPEARQPYWTEEARVY